MVWPGFDFPIQLLPQPQHWESEKERHSCLAAMKELPEGLLDDTNPPCLIYQSWFWSGLHTLALNWKKMLISNGKKEISLGVSNKDSMGISPAAHHNASEVYIHSLAPASLSQYLNPHQSGPWTWPVTIQHWCSVCLSSWIWRNTRHSKSQRIPQAFSTPHPPIQATNPHQMLQGHLCPLPDRRHLSAESKVPREQHQTSGWLVWVPTNTQSTPPLSLHLKFWSCTWVHYRLWHCLLDLWRNSHTLVFLLSLSGLAAPMAVLAMGRMRVGSHFPSFWRKCPSKCLFLPQRLPEPWGHPTPYHSIKNTQLLNHQATTDFFHFC